MLILGVDLSTVYTSCCFLTWETGEFDFEDIILKSRDYKKSSVLEARLIRCGTIAGDLVEKIKRRKPDVFAFEDLAYGINPKFSRSITAMAELRGIVLHHIYRYTNKGLPIFIPPREARKTYFGKDIGKKEALKELKKKYPKVIRNDNMSDSFLVAYCLGKKIDV